MGVSDYNLSGEQKRNIEHFASIVRLAMADNVITEGEEKLLKRLAKRFHILEDKYNEILRSIQPTHHIIMMSALNVYTI